MKNKKILSVVLAVALVASLAVGMTVAYLQDTDSDVNVMTMGNVYIKQNEQERVDTNELADAARAKFAEMKAKQEKKELRFSIIKSWFLELFPKFDVKKAKKEIREKKFKDAKAPYKVMKVSVKAPHSVNK